VHSAAQNYQTRRAGRRCADCVVQRTVKELIMNCPECGSERWKAGTRNVPYTYKGEMTEIAAVTGEFVSHAARWRWMRPSPAG
jgi:YgiT-type zinc finger domain-containing protein